MFFCVQLFANFLKIASFKKRVQKFFFSNFCVLSLNFENSLFLGLLKHYKNRGFSQFLWFLLLKKKKKAKNNDNWNFWFGFFLVQKWPFRDAHLFFKKNLLKPLPPPIFIVFFGCALFGPSCQKREILDTHQNKRKNLTDNWKALFWYFWCFFFFCFSVFLVVCFCFFFEGLRVRLRWPKGPPHLALNPPYLWGGVFFVFFFGVFWGGFKGQVRWPEGPPHLALNPPYLLFLFYWGGVFSFLFFAF